MNLPHPMQEHAPEAGGQESALPFEQLPSFIEGHIADGAYVEFMGFHLDVSAFQIPPIHLGPLTLDFTPTRHLFFLVLAALLCLAVFIPLARAGRRRDPSKAPSGVANAMEALVLYFRDEVVRPNIGHGADRYTPFILTLFFFILFMNLLGLSPLGVSPTGNLSVTAALAIIAFVATEVSGFTAQGAGGYARTIFYLPPGLPTVLKPVMLLIMTPVEFLGKLTKPFALAVRLFANMMAGHTLILAILGLIFVYQNAGVVTASIGIASVIMILELFVAFLQAYIFAMLTSVFIGLMRHAH